MSASTKVFFSEVKDVLENIRRRHGSSGVALALLTSSCAEEGGKSEL